MLEYEAPTLELSQGDPQHAPPSQMQFLQQLMHIILCMEEQQIRMEKLHIMKGRLQGMINIERITIAVHGI